MIEILATGKQQTPEPMPTGREPVRRHARKGRHAQIEGVGVEWIAAMICA